MIANKKPWGHECLAYQNENVAIWHLFIDPGQETSLHCHPNKKTGLVVLDGAAKIKFLSGENKLFSGEKVIIRQGVFHQTQNPLRHQLQLFEIETPVKKDDIVRINDKYGRDKQPYNIEPTINIDVSYPWDWQVFNEPVMIGSVFVNVVNVDFYKTKEIKLAQNNALFMIINGGIKYNDQYVLGCGDIIDCQNLNKLIKSFSLIENTKAITIVGAI